VRGPGGPRTHFFFKLAIFRFFGQRMLQNHPFFRWISTTTGFEGVTQNTFLYVLVSPIKCCMGASLESRWFSRYWTDEFPEEVAGSNPKET